MTDIVLAQNVHGDLDGNGVLDQVYGTYENLTFVVRDEAIIWHGPSPIGVWHRHQEDVFLAGDFDNDGKDEVLIFDNADGWTGLLKWNGYELAVLWASASPVVGPAGQWNRRGTDEFYVTTWQGKVAVGIFHPNALRTGQDQWRGTLLWQDGALQAVQIVKEKITDKDNKDNKDYSDYADLPPEIDEGPNPVGSLDDSGPFRSDGPIV